MATITMGVVLEVFGKWVETENRFNLLFCFYQKKKKIDLTSSLRYMTKPSLNQGSFI